MNSKEFLALVEQHPLPWTFCPGDDRNPPGYDHWRDPAIAEVPDLDGAGLTINLADAAPDMAAAILRALEAASGEVVVNPEITTAEALCDLTARMSPFFLALRASLPESLRP